MNNKTTKSKTSAVMQDLTDPCKWIYPKEKEELLKKITSEFKIHPVIAQVFISRNFKSIKQIHNYLYAKLPDLYDPYKFVDMDTAVRRVCLAIDKKERILIHGDNDVDGMTGTALLVEFLQKLGAKVDFYIPDSKTVKKDLFTNVHNLSLKTQYHLLITVDCGVTATEEIKNIVAKNIDVIITDHHEPTAKIPHCIATLNPKLLNSTYPNREITGVGVAFKLAHAITTHLIKEKIIKPDAIDLKQYLDLVALGTISDMGVLLEENRILVRYGITKLQTTTRIGLLRLFNLCEINADELSAADIASKIAPRLNSLGRIANPRKGVELLLTKNSEWAVIMALELELNNIERQKVERLISNDIDISIAKQPDLLKKKALILHSEGWHPGVIAIIASRLTKKYNRPALIIAINNNIGKGSMRTIREFPLLTVLKENKNSLISFGGHDYAAGLTIKPQNIEKFKKRFFAATDHALEEQDIITKLPLDAKADFNDLTFDFIESLNLLRPFGNENPSPLFYCDAIQNWPPKIIGKKHLKFFLEQNDRSLEGIGFNMANRKHLLKQKKQKLRIVFTPKINNFQNKASIQLTIRDFQLLDSEQNL